MKKKLKQSFCVFICFVISVTTVFASGFINQSFASTANIDQYIQVTSWSINGSGNVVVNYRTLKTIPTSININIGYRYPIQYRGSIPDVAQAVNRNPGTYTITLSKPIATVAKLVLSTKLTAQQYTETKVHGEWFHKPTSPVTIPHKVSSGEAGLQTFMYVVGPGLMIEFNSAIKAIEFIGATVLAWNLYNDFAHAFRWPQLHKIQVNNYILTTVTYTNDYRVIYDIKIYDTEDAYNSGNAPVSSVQSSFVIPFTH